MRIRIQGTNFYTFNRNPRFTLRQVEKHSLVGRPDSIGGQETGRPLSRGLRRFAGYKTFWKRSFDHQRKNNAVLVRRSSHHKVLNTEWYHAADGAGTRVTPPRDVFVVFYRKYGTKIAHINTHFHVVPEEKLAARDEVLYNKAARQYVEHVKFVRQLMFQFKREGYVVFVTADGNTRPKEGEPEWKYSAYRYLARGPFAVSRNIIDIIVHDNSLVQRVKFDVIDKRHLGQADHDSLRGEYELRD